MNEKELKKIAKKQVSLYIEKIEDILEYIEQDTLAEIEYKLDELYQEGHGYIDEEKLQDTIVDLIRKEVKRQI